MGHHHHAYDHSPASAGRLLAALLINVAITGLEFSVGLLVGSVALIADAFHNLSDVVALGLSYFGAKMELRRPNLAHSYGFGRTEVLVGLGNAVSLLAISLWIFYEAYEKILHPSPLSGLLVLGVGTFSLVGNVASVLVLTTSKDKKSINVRSAILHLALDAMSAVGVMIAAGLVMAFGWYRADPIASVVIGALVLWGSIGLIREGVHILMEGVPRGVDLEALADAMGTVPGVCGVHDMHVWNLSSTYRAMSAHVVISEEDGRRFDTILNELQDVLTRQHGIQHVTLQPEIEPCPADDLLCRQLPSDMEPHHGTHHHDEH